MFQYQAPKINAYDVVGGRGVRAEGVLRLVFVATFGPKATFCSNKSATVSTRTRTALGKGVQVKNSHTWFECIVENGWEENKLYVEVQGQKSNVVPFQYTRPV